ncbi:MAG: hypothetical protein ACFE0J_18000 [Elainellaceae cyanobacterium]
MRVTLNGKMVNAFERLHAYQAVRFNSEDTVLVVCEFKFDGLTL